MTFDPPHGQVQHISFFETTIRLVGGLVAAHDLSRARLFLDLAEDLGGRLLPVFEGGRPGVLTNTAQLPRTRAEPARTQYVLLAELGTNLIELGALAARSGNATFRRRAEDGLRFLHASTPPTRCWASRSTGAPARLATRCTRSARPRTRTSSIY